jgi:hypothetical protein
MGMVLGGWRRTQKGPGLGLLQDYCECGRQPAGEMTT